MLPTSVSTSTYGRPPNGVLLPPNVSPEITRALDAIAATGMPLLGSATLTTLTGDGVEPDTQRWIRADRTGRTVGVLHPDGRLTPEQARALLDDALIAEGHQPFARLAAPGFVAAWGALAAGSDEAERLLDSLLADGTSANELRQVIADVLTATAPSPNPVPPLDPYRVLIRATHPTIGRLAWDDEVTATVDLSELSLDDPTDVEVVVILTSADDYTGLGALDGTHHDAILTYWTTVLDPDIEAWLTEAVVRAETVSASVNMAVEAGAR